MGEELTQRQRKILEFIKTAIEEKGRPPTFREIGKKFGIKSTNGVNATLKALEKKGYLKRHSRLSRGIEITGTSFRRTRKIPVVGRVAAGEPVLAEQNIESYMAVDDYYLRGKSVFALTVRGDSMKDAGIFDGDRVFVNQQPTANSGEIIVAIIGDEATVKYFHPEKDKIRLEPANENFGPIIIEKETPGFQIAGKVIGLVRRI